MALLKIRMFIARGGGRQLASNERDDGADNAP
jgi:hypothetical protein